MSDIKHSDGWKQREREQLQAFLKLSYRQRLSRGSIGFGKPSYSPRGRAWRLKIVAAKKSPPAPKWPAEIRGQKGSVLIGGIPELGS
jgi:hypothetical protein